MPEPQSDEAEKAVRALIRYRKCQVMSVACGVIAFLSALIAGAFQNAVLARAGVGVFVACFVAIIVFGMLGRAASRKIQSH